MCDLFCAVYRFVGVLYKTGQQREATPGFAFDFRKGDLE